MRMRDFHAVCRDEGEARIDAEIRKRKAELATLLYPFKEIPEVELWADQYLVVAPRYKLLLLHADSRAGKTSFAESLFDSPFVVTVEDSPFLDLKGFDRSKHDGLVLDNVNSFGQVLRWRAVLQARNVKTKGAQSQTQMYSYSQYLLLVPVVATIDLDAQDSHLVEEGHPGASTWLLQNTVRVRLGAGETFYERPQRRHAAPRAPRSDTLFAEGLRRRRLMAPARQDF